ncbi:MAG: hypothetical protein BWY82_01542 [Verrucomicrobia bacterium ADurb.Bin474]|nr:MAG: hypothetical protein BWY82_01542 [Verrucomicrobia bacterium ADurb.Bin474]
MCFVEAPDRKSGAFSCLRSCRMNCPYFSIGSQIPKSWNRFLFDQTLVFSGPGFVREFFRMTKAGDRNHG